LLPRDDPSSITDMAKSESRRTAFVPDRSIFALPACESPLMHAESRTTPYGLPALQEKERLSAPGEDRGLSRNATTGALCRRWIHIMTGYGTSADSVPVLNVSITRSQRRRPPIFLPRRGGRRMSLRRLTSASRTSGDIKRASPIRFLQIATGKVSVSTGSSLGL
jgi:hypothetical protein